MEYFIGINKKSIREILIFYLHYFKANIMLNEAYGLTSLILWNAGYLTK
jgi:hypothetical protein